MDIKEYENAIEKVISQEKITNKSFISLTKEKIGLHLDFVFSVEEGWTDSILLAQEKPSKENWEGLLQLANNLKAKYEVLLIVKTCR